MKKIQLTDYQYENNKYSFVLGNGAKFVFKNETICKRTLTKYSHEITQLVYEINQNFIEVHNIYRLYWLSIDSPSFDRNGNNFVNQIIQALENCFIKRSENYSFFLFLHAFNALDSCQGLLKLIKLQSQSKSITFDIYRIELLEKRFIDLKNKFQNIGIIQCNEVLNLDIQTINNTLKIVS